MMSGQRRTRKNNRDATAAAEAEPPRMHRRATNYQSLKESVERNSEAIAKLQDLPQAISELKSLMEMRLTLPERNEENEMPYDDQYNDHEEDYFSTSQMADRLLQGSDEESPMELLNMFNQTRGDPVYGPPVDQQVADSFSESLKTQPPKEEIEKWKTLFKTPENCRSLTVPKVNPEIWGALPQKVKQRDLSHQQLQSFVMMLSINLARLSERIMKLDHQVSNHDKQELLQIVVQTATINSVVNKEINSKRKLDIRPSLSKEATSLCGGATVSTEWLFGDNVTEQLKASKSVQNLLKMQMPRSKYTRYSPYTSMPNRSIQGNFQRPPQSYQGGRQARSFQSKPINFNRRFTPKQPQFKNPTDK